MKILIFQDAYQSSRQRKDLKEMMTKEEKKEQGCKKKRTSRGELKSKYGVAIMDGKEVEVGNYMAEPQEFSLEEENIHYEEDGNQE